MREPQSNAAKVFFFGETGFKQHMRLWRWFAADTIAKLPTPGNADSQFIAIQHPAGLTTDLFCNGHSTLPDGKMIILGGSWTPLEPCEAVWTFNPSWMGDSTVSPWTKDAAMAVDRWYATATALPDGRVLASGGTSFSSTVAFGGAYYDGDTLKTDRVLRPLLTAGRFTWGDTTAAPANNNGAAGVWYDDSTAGQYPPSREGHAMGCVPTGTSILFGGRHRRGDGSYEYLNDVWQVEPRALHDDSSHSWRRLIVVGDTSISGHPMPVPRTRCAMTWAGVENKSGGMLPSADVQLTCYMQGGLDSNGNVLGDLWKGARYSTSG